MSLRLQAVAIAAAIALGGCSLSEDKDASKDQSTVASSELPPPRQGPVQKTRVDRKAVAVGDVAKPQPTLS